MVARTRSVSKDTKERGENVWAICIQFDCDMPTVARIGSVPQDTKGGGGHVDYIYIFICLYLSISLYISGYSHGREDCDSAQKHEGGGRRMGDIYFQFDHDGSDSRSNRERA